MGPPWWIMMNCGWTCMFPPRKLMRQNSENVHPVIFFLVSIDYILCQERLYSVATKSSAMFIWERQIYDMFHLEPTIFVSVCLADGHDGHTSAGVPVTMAYHGPIARWAWTNWFLHLRSSVMNWRVMAMPSFNATLKGVTFLFLEDPSVMVVLIFLPFLVVPFLDEVKGF